MTVVPAAYPGRAFPTDSLLPGMLPDESELTSRVHIEPGQRYGMLTDTTLCIGCKACEVACKQWNNLPADSGELTGHSYDNTSHFSATTWRHVAFIEQFAPGADPNGGRWLFMSDICKHCSSAPCLEACPTGAILKTEFDTVYIQQDVCNGCGYCVIACPFGVVALNETDGHAHKCTFCYDRLKGGLEPACAKSCPTDSIKFGLLDELVAVGERRVADLHAEGFTNAYLYGKPDDPTAPGSTGGIGGLNAFFLLLDRPEVYNLPAYPRQPSRKVAPGFASAGLGLAATLGAVVFGFLKGRRR